MLGVDGLRAPMLHHELLKCRRPTRDHFGRGRSLPKALLRQIELIARA